MTSPWAPQLRIQFHIDAKRVAEGHVVSISPDAIVAAFETDPDLAIPLGTRLTVVLLGSGPKTVHEARVMQRADTTDRIEYTFHTAGADSFTSSSKRNRRAAFRVAMSRKHPLEVALLPYDEGDDFEPVVAKISDMSRVGFGLEVPDEAEETLFTRARVRVRFELPGDPEPLELVGFVRQRRFRGMYLRYGIEFDEDHTAGFGELEERINRFVLRRQVDAIRRTHRWKPAS